MSGLPVAADQLVALVSCDATWSQTCRGLVSLLRRYSTGLSLGMAADELIAEFRAGQRAVPGPTIWVGEVLAVTSSPTPAWLVKLVDAPYQQRFVAHVHSIVSGFGVKPGQRFRLKPHVLKSDPSHHSPVHFTRFNVDAECQENDGPRTSEPSLLPIRHVVFEIALPSGEDMSSSFPDCALELFTKNSLLEVWNTRNTAPQWVSGEVVQIANNSIFIQDIGSASSSRPVIEIQLDPDDAVFTQLVSVKEQLLIRFPAVKPCGDSFSLSPTRQTVIFALPYRSDCLSHNAVQQEMTGSEGEALLSVYAPSAKRRRVPSLTALPDQTLADLKCRVTAAHVDSVTNPVSQPPFDMLTVVTSVHMIPHEGSDDIASGEVYVRACLEGQLTVDLPSIDQSFSLPCDRVAAGHVLWIEQIHWVPCLGLGSTGQWTARSFVNISSLPGILWSPFARQLVPVSSLLDSRVSRPGTVQVSCTVRREKLDVTRRSVLLDISDREQGSCRETGLIPAENCYAGPCGAAQVELPQSLVERFVGFKVHQEFWEKQNDSTESLFVGKNVMMSIAMSVGHGNKACSSLINIVTALSPAPG